MEKELYCEPEMEIIFFNSENAIITSGGVNGYEHGGDEEDDDDEYDD
jgi:hypothetical protein